MKAYIKAPSRLSAAMFRVANALERYAPDDVQIVQHENEADLLVLHVIGLDAVNYRTDKRCAVMQYCGGPDNGALSAWAPLWDRAVAVWSYLNLSLLPLSPLKFYRAPLGIDRVFCAPFVERPRDIGVLTMGCVNGSSQEALEEPIRAAQKVGLTTLHVAGPVERPIGFTGPLSFAVTPRNISDPTLARYYRRCKWIAGLRFVEGFELGVIEGLACGARPIVFDRSDNRHWFGEHARYVPECTGDRLTDWLAVIMSQEPPPVTLKERMDVLTRFNWKTLVTKFWNFVKERM